MYYSIFDKFIKLVDICVDQDSGTVFSYYKKIVATNSLIHNTFSLVTFHQAKLIHYLVPEVVSNAVKN